MTRGCPEGCWTALIHTYGGGSEVLIDALDYFTNKECH